MINDWPREPHKGYYNWMLIQSGDTMKPVGWSHWSFSDSALMAGGALFAGNYFGGEIKKMALQIADGTNYGGALGGGGGKDINRVSMVVNEDGDYAMTTDALFGEWAFGTGMAKRAASLNMYDKLTNDKVHHWYEKFHGTEGQPLNLNGHTGPHIRKYPGKNGEPDHEVISPVTWGWWPSTFHMQFVQFWFKIYHSNQFWFDMNNQFHRTELAYWADINNDPQETLFNAQGGQSNVYDKVFGCGAGYGMTNHNGHYGSYISIHMSVPEKVSTFNPDRIFNVPIMAGSLTAARTEDERASINEKIKYLWDEKACALKSAYDPPQYVLHRCSLDKDLPIKGITAIDYAEIVAAYLHNYLPKDFYHKYGISLGDFDQETLWPKE